MFKSRALIIHSWPLLSVTLHLYLRVVGMGEVTGQTEDGAGVRVRQSFLKTDPVGLGSSAVTVSSTRLKEVWAALRYPSKERLQQLRQREA